MPPRKRTKSCRRNGCGGDSIKVIGLGVGPVNGGVASGGPAGAVTNVPRMVHVTDVKASGRALTLGLGMTPQAKVRVANRQQFRIHRSVGAVAGGAPFAERRMLKNERPGLFPMALGAGSVDPGHG